MKNIFTLFIAVLLLSACKSKETDELVKPASAELYKFKSIEYSVEKPTDGVQETSVFVPTVVYKNGTSVKQIFTYNPIEGIKQTSIFTSTQKEAFSLLNNDSVNVTVPVAIDANNITLGSKKWLYTNKQMEQPTAFSLKDSVAISAYKSLTLKMSAIIRKLTATYTATFQSQTGKELRIKGEWIGTFPAGANVTSQTEDLN